ncbi:MAG: nucleoside hydrolase [Chloroflexi bacterium]|nr:nucleoside hydrolase [Chloroflexota bacterium]
MSFRKPIIVDTDAGVDDAVAFLLLLNDPAVEVKAITTVSGNVSVDKVTRNIGLLLAELELDIPIYSGSALPLWGQPLRSEDIMGEDGFGGTASQFSRLPRLAENEAAASALVRLAKDYQDLPGFTLVALGPLTNIALAVRMDPGFAAHVPYLVVMGGAVHAQGNTSAAAEFNTFSDPEAAQIVFSAGFADVALISWETSLKNPLPWEDYERLASLSSPKAQLFAAITHSLSQMMKDQFHMSGFILPDLLAAAAAVDASLATHIRPGFIDVDTAYGVGRGLTAVRWQFDHGTSANVRVFEDVNATAIFERLTIALGRK